MFAKTMNFARKCAAPALALASAVAVSAHADAAYDPIFTAVDLAGISTKVVAIGVIIIGIALVMKAITLGKKTVNKA